MNNLQKISRCLISVSDKAGVVELARFLIENGVEIISTGGTFKLLQQNQINAKDISENNIDEYGYNCELLNGEVEGEKV